MSCYFAYPCDLARLCYGNLIQPLFFHCHFCVQPFADRSLPCSGTSSARKLRTQVTLLYLSPSPEFHDFLAIPRYSCAQRNDIASLQPASAALMKLLVRGPAFGLPSIDAECIAAVALLRLLEVEQWELVPTHDDGTRLPLLLAGERQFTGYSAIARYLKDTAATPARTDAIPIHAFLEANAQTLLDVSLYVSFENYRGATRPAFTKILPWYANYITPPRLRNAARARTEHLGISSIDVDNVHDDMSNNGTGADGVGRKEGFEAETQQRASLLLPRKETVRSLLRRPAHAAVFRLNALAENFFQPLQELLGERDFLCGNEPTDLDCLAYGYLSLMLYPELPQDWLSATMRRSYQNLVRYTERLDERFRTRTCVADVVALTKCQSEVEVENHRMARHMQLPWHIPPRQTFAQQTVWTLRSLVEYMIPIAQGSKMVLIHPRNVGVVEKYGLAFLAGVSASAGLGLYYSFATGLLHWPRGEEVQIFGRKRFADYGHLGAALAGLSMLNRDASGDAAFHEQQRHDVPVQVEVVADPK